MNNAIIRSKLSEQKRTRAAYEAEVRHVCLSCPLARCEYDKIPDDAADTCPRFEQHFRIIKQLAAHIGIKVDPAADGETDSFFEFLN